MHVYQSPYAVYHLYNAFPLRGRALYIDTRHSGTDINALLVNYFINVYVVRLMTYTIHFQITVT